MIITFLGRISATTRDNIIEHNRTKYKIWIRITNSTYCVNGYIYLSLTWKHFTKIFDIVDSKDDTYNKIKIKLNFILIFYNIFSSGGGVMRLTTLNRVHLYQSPSVFHHCTEDFFSVCFLEWSLTDLVTFWIWPWFSDLICLKRQNQCQLQ